MEPINIRIDERMFKGYHYVRWIGRMVGVPPRDHLFILIPVYDGLDNVWSVENNLFFQKTNFNVDWLQVIGENRENNQW